MFEILSPDLRRIGEVETFISDNHSIHWQESGTLTLIADATENNLQNLQVDRFILIRDDFRQGGRLDGLYLICNVAHDEDKHEVTVNGKTAGFLLHQRAVKDIVLKSTTAGAAMAKLANDNARGLPVEAEAAADADPEVIRYPIDGGALDEKCSDLMSYCGIGMEAKLDGEKVKLRFFSGRDISSDASVPVLGKQSGWARSANLSVDSSDFCNVAIGTLVYQNNTKKAFEHGDTDAQGADRRELFIGAVNQSAGESDSEFKDRAKREADEKLLSHLLRTTISADISPADYGRPFLVGDLVRVQVGSVTLKKRISVATWLHDQNNDRVTLTLGDQINTVVAEIKANAKSNAARAGSAAKAAQENKERQDGIESDYKNLLAQVNGIVAGMDAYVIKKVFEDYKEATARLFAALEEEDESIKSELTVHAESIEDIETTYASLVTRVSGAETALEMQSQSIDDLETASTSLSARTELAEASIKLNASNIDGVKKSIVDINADITKLNGRVDVTGVLTVKEGAIESSGSIYAPNQTISGGTLKSQDMYASRELYLRDVKYEPKEITSTSGAILALGTA